MLKMEFSSEKDNFVKLSYILFDVIARHLREYFVRLWDMKYPNEKWHNDVAKRDSKLRKLLVTRDGRQKQDAYSNKIMKGDEQEWDITISIKAILDSGFKLIEGCRPQDKRSIPLLESEELEIIRSVRNSDYAHLPSMSCTMDEFIDIMIKVNRAAGNLFGIDAEKEIYRILLSSITAPMREQVKTLLEEPYTEKDIVELKERYTIQYQKHGIHKVDKHHRIVIEEVNLHDFAVKLKISDTRPAAATFRDETRQHFEHLKGIAGKDIELNELLNHDKRVVLVCGVPGMGKTVLTKQLAFLWANNKIYTQFRLCIIMECRDINHFAANEGATLKRHELFSAFLKAKFGYDLGGGVSTLLIIDGLDELDGINTNDSVIWQLLDVKHAKYTKAKIILTGRPHVECHLERKGKDIGGLQRCEIQGLSDDQIQDYVKKFASCKEEFDKIDKAIHSSKEHVKILSIPAFLNSMCCVTLLSDVQTVKNTAELYVWVIYLLLKEHVEKDGPGRKMCWEIFEEYSSGLWGLCEICHQLLSENKIIFEGDVKSQLLKCGNGAEFIEGLFADISDCRTKKYQFKHLTIIEFLSAVHVSRRKNRMEIIEHNLKTGFYQVVIFCCQLIGGYKYDGIIKDMFGNDEKLKEITVEHFLPRVLEYLGQGINHELKGYEQQQQQLEHLFKLANDIIMCFTNEDVSNKNFIISTVKTLDYEMDRLYSESMRRVSDLCGQLSSAFKCNEEELKDTFEHLHVKSVDVEDINALACVKYLPNVERIVLLRMKIDNSFRIREEANVVANCKEVGILMCELADDEIVENMAMKDHQLNRLEIFGCKVNKYSFINVCNWALASVTIFYLYDIRNIEHSWWGELVDVIQNAKENNNLSLALRELQIKDCAQRMSKEMEMKILQCGVQLEIDGRKIELSLQSALPSMSTFSSSTSTRPPQANLSSRRCNIS